MSENDPTTAVREAEHGAAEARHQRAAAHEGVERRHLQADALAHVLARIEAKVDALLKVKNKPKRVLLSFNEAARVLGVSRNDTLHELVATKQIRAVQVRGRWKIPASEIERIQREGVIAA